MWRAQSLYWVCACGWMGARARAPAMNIAFRYLGRANCPRECLEAVLISCQSEFGIRHARLENASDSFSIILSSLPPCALRGERKGRRRDERVECFLLSFKCSRMMRELDLNFACDVILVIGRKWFEKIIGWQVYKLECSLISLFGRQRSGDSFLEKGMKISRYWERESEKASGF